MAIYMHEKHSDYSGTNYIYMFLTKSFAVHERMSKAYNMNERWAKREHNMSKFIN